MHGPNIIIYKAYIDNLRQSAKDCVHNSKPAIQNEKHEVQTLGAVAVHSIYNSLPAQIMQALLV